MSFNPFKAVTRAVGIPDKAANIIADVFPVTALFGAKPYGVGAGDILKLGTGLLQGVIQPKNQNVSQSTLPQYLGHDPYNISYQAPNYQAPYYGGGGSYDAYSYQPQFNPYGGQPSWGYSTMYSQPLTPQYQVSSARPDRSWEDLAAIALPFFL